MKRINKIIIIPDVHGRIFWKEIVYHVIKNEEDTHIVFLGDYLDPYDSEGISFEDAIANFEEIIDLKKRCPKQITLLLGNHDCGYIWPEVCSSRRNRFFYKEVNNLFNENFKLFDLAYQITINDKEYLFTHAGVHKAWLDLLIYEEPNIKFINIADYLNNWLHVEDYDKESLLGIYSYFRGYFGEKYGSCVWADVREWSSELDNVELNKQLNCYQIFGHTQLESEPIIKDSFACLDVRRYFILENGELKDSKKE